MYKYNEFNRMLWSPMSWSKTKSVSISESNSFRIFAFIPKLIYMPKNDTFYRGITLDSVKSLMCYPLSIYDSFGSFRTLFDLDMIINHCGMLCRVNSKLRFCASSQNFLTICGFLFVGTVLNTVFFGVFNWIIVNRKKSCQIIGPVSPPCST